MKATSQSLPNWHTAKLATRHDLSKRSTHPEPDVDSLDAGCSWAYGTVSRIAARNRSRSSASKQLPAPHTVGDLGDDCGVADGGATAVRRLGGAAVGELDTCTGKGGVLHGRPGGGSVAADAPGRPGQQALLTGERTVPPAPHALWCSHRPRAPRKTLPRRPRPPHRPPPQWRPQSWLQAALGRCGSEPPPPLWLQQQPTCSLCLQLSRRDSRRPQRPESTPTTSLPA